MKKRYRVIYVGDDSCNHFVDVWANNHSEAERLAKEQCDDVDMVTGIKRLTNPFVIWGIALVVVVLIIIELIN